MVRRHPGAHWARDRISAGMLDESGEIASFVLGLVVGLATKRRGRALALEVVGGLVYLPALALALAVLFPWTLWERSRRMLHRDVQHFHRVFIEIDRYDAVLECIAACLHDHGLVVRTVPAPLAVRVSRWLADHLGPPAFRDRTPYVLHALVGKGVGLAVYPSLLDLVVSKQAIGRARSALWGQLPPEGFWWTRSPAARELEASILGRYGEPPDDIPEKLATLEGGPDEWRALQQEYLMVTHGPAAQRAEV